MKNTTQDLTTGPIYQKLIAFAVPFLLANFLQALYGTVDTVIVGWFTNTAGIAAVSIGSQIMMLVNQLVAGLTMGGTILVGMYLGAKSEQDVRETIGTLFSLFCIIAILLSVMMYFGLDHILHWVRTPSEAYPQTRQYTAIAIIGVVFTFLYNAISAILRGLGNSTTPLLFIAIACIGNIFLDFAFIGGLHLGASGAALATILAQALSMILSIIYLKRRDFMFDFRLSSYRIHRQKAQRLLQVGIPISIHETMVGISFLILSAVVNTLGVSAAAAVGISGKFNGFAMLPAGALAGAIAAMVAQNMGARKLDRARHTLWIGVMFSFLSALIFFSWIQISPASVMKLFKGSDAVIAAGSAYMKAFSWDFLLVAFVFCMNGFFNGCGRTQFSLFNGLLSTFLLRIPLVFILKATITPPLFGIGLAAPIASAASIFVGLGYYWTGRWQKKTV